MASGPVWNKRTGGGGNSAALAFTSGWDVLGKPPADARLAAHDLSTNAAHLLMLAKRRIVSAADARAIAKGLLALKKRLEAGESFLDAASEDIHMSTESALAKSIGTASGRLHTARSRNDQAATDMRLWLRAEALRALAEMLELHAAIETHARAHMSTPCPGFTHAQPAMISSWGHWCASYLPPLERASRALLAVLDELVECPLGAAAGFGTSWPIDRAFVAKLLGFARPSASSIDAVATRGEAEARFAFALAQGLATLAKIGQDLIFLTTPPRAWLRLDDAFVTGSSIMPQKRNPDFAEVAQGRAAVARGYVDALLAIPPAIPGAYHRALQWTKYVAFDAADNAAGAFSVFAQAFESLAVDKRAMRDACADGFLDATDLADTISSRRGVPFRDAYKLVGEIVRECETEGRISATKVDAALARAGLAPLSAAERRAIEDPAALLDSRRAPGGPSSGAVKAALDTSRSTRKKIASELRRRQSASSRAEAALWLRLRGLASTPKA